MSKEKKKKKKKRWYSLGYDRKKLKDMGKGLTENIRINDGESVTVRFLSNEAFCFYQHYSKSLNRYFTCLEGTGETCPLCKRGVQKTFRGAYPVIDRKDEKVKIYSCGIRMLKTIDKMLRKYETLKKRDFEIEREGAGTSTVYTLVPDDKKSSLTDKEKSMPQPDLQKIFKPKSADEILELFEETGVKDKDKDDDDDEDEVPF